MDHTSSHKFELELATLGYRAPQLIAAMLEGAGVEAERRLAVLDAGCGTGLCSPLLCPYAAHLVGVDRSGRMLHQAREKGVYGDLVKRELTAYLGTQSAAYDLIVSADPLVYFGGLDAVIGAAAGALRPGALLVFTVEELSDAGAPGGHRINARRTLLPFRDYVLEVLEREGFRPHLARAELRMEGGVPVDGLAGRAARPELWLAQDGVCECETGQKAIQNRK